MWRGVQRRMARATSRPWESQDPQRPSLFLQTLTLIAQLEFSAAAVAVINYAPTFLGPSTTPDSSALLTQLSLISHRLHRPFWRGLQPTTASLLSHLADEKMEAMCRKLKLQDSDFKTYRLTAQSMLALWQPMTPSTSLGALPGRRSIVEPWFWVQYNNTNVSSGTQWLF